jgi:hypothetical protein
MSSLLITTDVATTEGSDEAETDDDADEHDVDDDDNDTLPSTPSIRSIQCATSIPSVCCGSI